MTGLLSNLFKTSNSLRYSFSKSKSINLCNLHIRNINTSSYLKDDTTQAKSDDTMNAYLQYLNTKNNSNYDKISDFNTGQEINLANTVEETLNSTQDIKLTSSSNANLELVVQFSDLKQEQKVIELSAMLKNILENKSKIPVNTEVSNERIKELIQKINEIDIQLEPLLDICDKIKLKADRTADNILLGFLSVWTITTVSIARLTWWEYSWDIMEPVAWAAQAGGMLFWGWYYFIFRYENSMTDIRHRIHDSSFRKKLEKANFSVEKYNELVTERQRYEQELLELTKYKRR